ncbi:MAG: hypothetical protein Q7U74_04000 [Saprospiraceae bacterium]|nr:hypothetical protein [Saprospiraceae bacterium]
MNRVFRGSELMRTKVFVFSENMERTLKRARLLVGEFFYGTPRIPKNPAAISKIVQSLPTSYKNSNPLAFAEAMASKPSLKLWRVNLR